MVIALRIGPEKRGIDEEDTNNRRSLRNPQDDKEGKSARQAAKNDNHT